MHTLISLINKAAQEDADNEFRRHLGGSMIGAKCERALWYSFRWADSASFEGRMLRLFARGQREEEQFVRYLRRVGAEVREFSMALWYNEATKEYMLRDWDADNSGGTGAWLEVTHDYNHVRMAEASGLKMKQWRIHDVGGHFGGSLDGIARNVPELGLPKDGSDVLLEFKTHNAKSFAFLRDNCLERGKPQHFVQMQVYMLKRGISWGLYMAVNKNDDDLYTEVVPVDPEVGRKAIERAHRIIHAKQPPLRIGNNPSWFDCKYCDFRDVCHYGKPMRKSCRSCVFATPVADGDKGDWHCGKWNTIIPVDAVPIGCEHYKTITD